MSKDGAQDEITRRFFCGCIACVLAPSAMSQILGQIAITGGCSYSTDSSGGTVYTFASDQEALDAVQRVLATIGARSNFEVLAASVTNASAAMRGGRRYILYSQTFIESVRRATHSTWGPLSIIAHEIGHHLNGDTFGINGISREQSHRAELEADRFSGAALQKLGASLEDSLSAIRFFGSATGSDSHPDKQTRIAAIANGWQQSADLVGRKSPTETSRSTPQQRSPGDNPAECTVVLKNPAARIVGTYRGQCQGGYAHGEGEVEMWAPPPPYTPPGKMTLHGGFLYSGQFVNGRASGTGRIKKQDGSFQFVGEIRNWEPWQGAGSLLIDGSSKQVMFFSGEGNVQ